MRKISFMLLWIVAICTANAQVKHLAIEIANAQKENVVFTDISSSIKEASVQTQSLDLAEHFVNPNEVYVFDYTPVKTRSNATASPAVKLRLPIGNAYKNIELIEVPDNFYDYVVTTSSGETYQANRNIKHYRGIVEGDSTSLVALSFYNDEMSGIIATDDGNYNVGKSEQLGKHILYNDKNLKEKQEFFCDTYDDFEEVYDPEVLSAEYNAAASVSRYKFVKFYLETEYDIYQKKGNVGSVESFISAVFNQVATIYYNDGTCIKEFVAGRIPIGVVVYMDTVDNEKWIMALDDAGDFVTWSTEIIDIPDITTYSIERTAVSDLKSCENTEAMLALGESTSPTAAAAKNYAPLGAENTKGKWCLPSLGIWNMVDNHLTEIDAAIFRASGTALSGNYWSSSEESYDGAWAYSGGGVFTIFRKDLSGATKAVRPVMKI